VGAARGSIGAPATSDRGVTTGRLILNTLRPVSAIKPVLRREWARIGGSICNPDLTDYATLISERTRNEMKVK